MDKATLVAILTKLADRNPELYTWLETSLPIAVVDETPATCPAIPQAGCAGGAREEQVRSSHRPTLAPQ